MRFSHLPGVGRLLLCLDGALTLEREHGGESAVPKSGAALAFQGDERIVGRPESTAAAGTTAAATTTTTTHAISSDGEVDKHPMCRSFGVLYRRDCYRDASMTLVSGGSTGSGVVAAPCCVIHAPSRNRAAVVLRCAGGVGCAVDADIVLMPGETLVTSGSVAATCGGSGDVVALCGFTPAATSKL